MKRYMTSIAVAVSVLTVGQVSAQMVKDNSKISCEAKKVSGNKYKLIVHMNLEKGWHVYSMQPGGDGSLIGANVTFASNPKVKPAGKIKENGKLLSVSVEGVKGKINMYEGKVDYIQEAEINGATTVTGSYEYQICNDMMCLPPTRKDLKIIVKG